MGNNDLNKLKEGLEKTEKQRTIISAGISEDKKKLKEESKTHAHFYIDADILDKIREFQIKHRKEFPRLSHVVENALKEFLKKK